MGIPCIVDVPGSAQICAPVRERCPAPARQGRESTFNLSPPSFDCATNILTLPLIRGPKKHLFSMRPTPLTFSHAVGRCRCLGRPIGGRQVGRARRRARCDGGRVTVAASGAGQGRRGSELWFREQRAECILEVDSSSSIRCCVCRRLAHVLSE